MLKIKLLKSKTLKFSRFLILKNPIKHQKKLLTSISNVNFNTILINFKTIIKF